MLRTTKAGSRKGGAMPFESFTDISDEAVVARLSFEIPTDGIVQAAELASLSNQLQTNMEAAARFSADFVEYLKQIPQIQRDIAQSQQDVLRNLGQQQTITQQIHEDEEINGYPRAFGGEEARRADYLAQRGRLPSAQIDDSGHVTGTAVVNGQEAPLEDPNTQQAVDNEARNRARKESGSWAEQLGQYGGNLSSVTRLASARDAGSMISAAQGLASGVGGAGAAANMAAKVAGPLAIAAAGYKAFDETNEFYQSERTLGLTRGGGFGEGVGYDMTIRGMALSPWLSTDQARQIVMSGLNEGYSGKELETVTDFMAKNLKDMNISVADSVKVLRTNVEQGGQSIENFASQMSGLKAMATNSNTSLSDMTSGVISGSAALVGAGASGTLATSTMVQAQGLFQSEYKGEKSSLAGQGDEILSGALTNTGTLAVLAQRQGKGKQAVSMASDPDSPKLLFDLLKEVAARFKPLGDQGIVSFMNVIKEYGINLTLPQARELMERLLSGEDVWGSGKAFGDESVGEVVQVSSDMGVVGGDFKAIGGAAATVGKFGINAIKGIVGLATGKSLEETSAPFRSDADEYRRAVQNINLGRGYAPKGLESYLRSDANPGAEYIWVVKEDGTRESLESMLINGLTEEEANKLSNGTWKLAKDSKVGGSNEGQSLQDFVTTGGASQGGSGAFDSSWAKTSVEISLTDEARRLLGIEVRTDGQTSADQGKGGVTPNQVTPTGR
jgi:hypothetical protein